MPSRPLNKSERSGSAKFRRLLSLKEVMPLSFQKRLNDYRLLAERHAARNAVWPEQGADDDEKDRDFTGVVIQ